VEFHARCAAFCADDLNVFPTNAAHTGAQGFHSGFFGCETTSQVWRAPTAVGYLIMCEDALQEPLTVAIENLFDAGNLNDVDACC
jgi:hypothetical protein